MLAVPPIDFATHDTYFVVAHFHSIVIGPVLRRHRRALLLVSEVRRVHAQREAWARSQFWFLFIGMLVFTFPQYIVGLLGMPRRVASLPAQPAMEELNDWSTVGAVIVGISFAHLRGQRRRTAGSKPIPAGDNPWDAHTLEWFTTSPPPHHNFSRLPPIRSERPTWDYNHPEHRSLAHGIDAVHKHEHAHEPEVETSA